MEHKTKQLTGYRAARKGLNNLGKEKDRSKSQRRKKGKPRK